MNWASPFSNHILVAGYTLYKKDAANVLIAIICGSLSSNRSTLYCILLYDHTNDTGLYSVPFCCSTSYILDEVGHIRSPSFIVFLFIAFTVLSCPLKGPLQT